MDKKLRAYNTVTRRAATTIAVDYIEGTDGDLFQIKSLTVKYLYSEQETEEVKPEDLVNWKLYPATGLQDMKQLDMYFYDNVLVLIPSEPKIVDIATGEEVDVTTLPDNKMTDEPGLINENPSITVDTEVPPTIFSGWIIQNSLTNNWEVKFESIPTDSGQTTPDNMDLADLAKGMNNTVPQVMLVPGVHIPGDVNLASFKL